MVPIGTYKKETIPGSGKSLSSCSRTPMTKTSSIPRSFLSWPSRLPGRWQRFTNGTRPSLSPLNPPRSDYIDPCMITYTVPGYIRLTSPLPLPQITNSLPIHRKQTPHTRSRSLLRRLSQRKWPNMLAFRRLILRHSSQGSPDRPLISHRPWTKSASLPLVILLLEGINSLQGLRRIMNPGKKMPLNSHMINQKLHNHLQGSFKKIQSIPKEIVEHP